MAPTPCPLCACEVTCPHSENEREAVWTFYEIGTIGYMLEDGPIPEDWRNMLVEKMERATQLPPVSPILTRYYKSSC